MRVRCIRAGLTQLEERELMQSAPPLEIGREYLVLAMWYFGNHLWFVVPDDVNYIEHIPAFLFEVVDPRLSATWQLSIESESVFKIEPPGFTAERHLMEQLVDQNPETLAMFQRVMETLEEEEEEARGP